MKMLLLFNQLSATAAVVFPAPTAHHPPQLHHARAVSRYRRTCSAQRCTSYVSLRHTCQPQALEKHPTQHLRHTIRHPSAVQHKQAAAAASTELCNTLHNFSSHPPDAPFNSTLPKIQQHASQRRPELLGVLTFLLYL